VTGAGAAETGAGAAETGAGAVVAGAGIAQTRSMVTGEGGAAGTAGTAGCLPKPYPQSVLCNPDSNVPARMCGLDIVAQRLCVFIMAFGDGHHANERTRDLISTIPYLALVLNKYPTATMEPMRTSTPTTSNPI
jgi:hypothetical protein